MIFLDRMHESCLNGLLGGYKWYEGKTKGCVCESNDCSRNDQTRAIRITTSNTTDSISYQ